MKEKLRNVWWFSYSLDHWSQKEFRLSEISLAVFHKGLPSFWTHQDGEEGHGVWAMLNLKWTRGVGDGQKSQFFLNVLFWKTSKFPFLILYDILLVFVSFYQQQEKINDFLQLSNTENDLILWILLETDKNSKLAKNEDLIVFWKQWYCHVIRMSEPYRFLP